LRDLGNIFLTVGAMITIGLISSLVFMGLYLLWTDFISPAIESIRYEFRKINNGRTN
jgi:hypothetical protein